MLQYPWDVVCGLTETLADDWQDSDAGIEVDLDPRVIVDPKDRVHIGQRCAVHPTVVIAADQGPVYLGEDVQLGPYVVIEGPAFIGAGSIINAHARLHGGCAIGPVCIRGRGIR